MSKNFEMSQSFLSAPPVTEAFLGELKPGVAARLSYEHVAFALRDSEEI